MKLPELLAELGKRGVRLRAVGDTLWADGPRSELSPSLREALAQHKSTLLRIAAGADERHRDASPADAARIPDAVTWTAEQLAAFASLCTIGNIDASILDAAHAVLSAPTAEQGRAGIARLENLSHPFRALRRRALQGIRRASEDRLAQTSPGRPRVVGIADPCLVCGGTEYWLPARNGLCACVHCYPQRPAPRILSKRRSRHRTSDATKEPPLLDATGVRQ